MRRFVGPVLFAAACLVVTGCQPIGTGGALVPPSPAPAVVSTPNRPAPTTTSPASQVVSPTSSAAPAASDRAPALAALDLLPVADPERFGDYRRDLFGQRWSDDVDVAGGHNGCDTRNDILRRDLHDVVARPGTRECVIASGTLLDPYTGAVVDFVRGPDSDDVQIDHVVALSDAWAKGARHLEPQRRVDLANDPLNLLAVDGPTNQAKGNADASRWLPPDPAAHCDYAARQVAVKLRYQLWVSPDEKEALDRVLRSCPGQELPVG